MKHLLLTILFVAAILGMNAKTTARIDSITIQSRYMQSPMTTIVIVPDADDTTTPRPTVYMLHGYSDNYRCWPYRTQPALDSLAATYGMIIVCPDGRDTWYMNSKVDPKRQMESFMTRELVPAIDSLYPTVAMPSKRAITGLSMGGHGAWYLALRHPDIWGNVGSTSGGVDISRFPGRWKIDKTLGEYDRTTWQERSILYMVDSLKPGQLNIIFDCGTDDFFHEANEDLHAKLTELKIPHDYISRPGAHTHPYWRNAILFQLQFFNQKFQH